MLIIYFFLEIYFYSFRYLFTIYLIPCSMTYLRKFLKRICFFIVNSHKDDDYFESY